MNNATSKKKTLLPIITGFLGCLIVCSIGCTKHLDNMITEEETWYDTVGALPDSRIIAYKVANVNDAPIYSAINDSLKTITVYLPAYYQLGIIQPEIELPAGAAISPAADEPVPVFYDKPFQYQVTSSKGVKATYTVHIIVQQQSFTIRELTADPANPITISDAAQGGIIAVTGENMLASYAVTKSFLMDADGKQVYALGSGGYTQPMSNRISFGHGPVLQMPVIPAGLYWLEVRSYALTRRMVNPIRVL